jgi:hypothetical protein
MHRGLEAHERHRDHLAAVVREHPLERDGDTVATAAEGRQERAPDLRVELQRGGGEVPVDGRQLRPFRRVASGWVNRDPLVRRAPGRQRRRRLELVRRPDRSADDGAGRRGQQIPRSRHGLTHDRRRRRKLVRRPANRLSDDRSRRPVDTPDRTRRLAVDGSGANRRRLRRLRVEQSRHGPVAGSTLKIQDHFHRAGRPRSELAAASSRRGALGPRQPQHDVECRPGRARGQRSEHNGPARIWPGRRDGQIPSSGGWLPAPLRGHARLDRRDVLAGVPARGER